MIVICISFMHDVSHMYFHIRYLIPQLQVYVLLYILVILNIRNTIIIQTSDPLNYFSAIKLVCKSNYNINHSVRTLANSQGKEMGVGTENRNYNRNQVGIEGYRMVLGIADLIGIYTRQSIQLQVREYSRLAHRQAKQAVLTKQHQNLMQWKDCYVGRIED